jgi:hypothetical protein
MTQGQGASLCIRAYTVTGDGRWLECARRALELMVADIADGGTARRTSEGTVLEEVPSSQPQTILNGFLFAVVGLYDFQLARGSSAISHWLDQSLTTLRQVLHRYDAGYWSLYDLSGTIASPFYHDLHVAQLHALASAFPDDARLFTQYASLFARQRASPFNRVRAITVKVIQKLREPPQAVLE